MERVVGQKLVAGGLTIRWNGPGKMYREIRPSRTNLVSSLHYQGDFRSVLKVLLGRRQIMEEYSGRSARLAACVIAGIGGSLLPSGFISFAMLVSLGWMPWEEIIYITASGALGGSLVGLIVGKSRGGVLVAGVLVAGIFGFIAGVITLFYIINYL